MADNKNPLFAKGLKEVYPSDNLLGVNNELATLANQYDNNFVNNLPQGQQDALNSIPNIGNAISKVTEKATKTSQDYQTKMRDIDPYGSAVNMQASLEAVDQASAQQEAMLAAQRAMLERGNQADDLNYQNDLNSLAVQKLQLQNALTGKAIGIDPKEGLHRIKNYQSSMTRDIEEAQRANEIQARMSLLEGKAQELGMRYGQQKANNALNMLKQEMAEDNLMKSKAEASEQLYNALLQQSSDDRYKGLIDNQATVDLSKKPIETDFLPSVYHGFVDSVADIPRGLGAITNAVTLSAEEKQQRLEALKNLTPDQAPTNWLGDNLIKLGNRMSDSDIDYQNKYNLDNMLLDADSAKGAINTALGIGKNAAGIVANTLVSAAPEIFTTAISTGTIPTALRTAKIAARAGQIAEDVGAGLAKVSNVATKLEKPVANWSSVATGEATKATKFTADKFSPEVFRTNLSGYVSEDVAKKVASKLGANATPSMAGKALRETLTKAEKLELAKVSWVKDSAKLFGGITGLSAEVTQKMHNAQIDRMKQQGIDPDKLGYLVSLNKNDIVPAMTYTALNLVEFGTLFKPLLGGKATRELVSAAKEKSLPKFFDTLKEVGKSIVGDKGATLGAAAIGALKLGGNAAAEGATEFAQTVTEAMMRDNDLKGTLGDYYDAVRNVLANPKSYKEVKEAGITGAIAGAGTHVTGQIAPSVAKESLSKVASLASKSVNKVSEYVTANKVQAQKDINNVSNLNAKAENSKDVSLKELYQVAVSPKAKEAFLNEPDTDNNKEYKSIVEDLANINPNADTKALAEKLATKYPKYTQEQLADIIHISKNRDTKYSDADISKLSQPIREAIESVDQESYDNSKVKAMFKNKSYEELTLGERYAITPSKPVEQRSTESKPTIEVTKDHRLVASLEGSKEDKNKANTYITPIDVEKGDLKQVTKDSVNDFDRVFSKDNLSNSDNSYKSKKDVRTAYRAFATTLAIAEAAGNTQETSIKDTYIGGLINSIRKDILLAENPVKAYEELKKNNNIEAELLDLILEDIDSRKDEKSDTIDIASPVIDMLTSSDIAKPEEEKIDTEVRGTQGSTLSPDQNMRSAIDGLEKIFDSAYGTDKKTRKLRNINKMTALGVTASKAAEAIKKFKYVVALREASIDTTTAVNAEDVRTPTINTETLVNKVLAAQEDLKIAQKQTAAKLDVISKFFGKNNEGFEGALKAYGIPSNKIKDYIHTPKTHSGIQQDVLLAKIHHNTGVVSFIPGNIDVKNISDTNAAKGRDEYILYIPIKTVGQDNKYALASTDFAVSDNAEAKGTISLVDQLKNEVKVLDEASTALDAYIKSAIPQVEEYLDKSTLKFQVELNEKLVTMSNGISKLVDESVKDTIRDTLGRLNRANKDIKLLEFYIEKLKENNSFFGDADWNIKVNGNSVTLQSIPLIKAQDLLTSLLSERDNLTYNMQIFFNSHKDIADIIALVGMWNASKIEESDLNPYMSKSLTAKAKSLLKNVVKFFTGVDEAQKKFKALLKQVNSTRAKTDQITEKGIEELSHIILDADENSKLSKEQRYELIDTSFRVLGVLSTQTEKKYGFGDTDNLLSDILPDAKTIMANVGYVDLSKNLVGGYYIPSANRIPSYAMFDRKFKMSDYDVEGALEFKKFKDAVKVALTKNAYNLNPDNLFLDLFDVSKVSGTVNNIGIAKDKVVDLKEAVTRSIFMSIMGLLSNEKLIAPLAKVSSNLKDTEENQRVSSTYQATIIVNDLLRNFGLVEPNSTKTAGEIATEQLKNMVQQILKLAFSEIRDGAVVIDSKTNVIKLKDKDYLQKIQDRAKAFTDRGYISPKEVAAKEQLSDVLKDIKLSQKGNKLSTETDPRVVEGILAQTLTPLEYNLTKMGAMVTHLASGGKNLAYEVRSMLNPIFTATDFYRTGKMKLSTNLWSSQVEPIVIQAAKELGMLDSNISDYVKAFKDELIIIDDNISKNSVAEELLASTDIPRLNNKIQSFIEVIQESKSNRGQGTQFYYNVFAGPNDRTTIDGTGHQQSNKNIRHLIQKIRDPEEAKKLFEKEFSRFVYKGKDLETAKKKAIRNLLLALGTGLDIIDLTKLANGEYRERVTKIVKKYSEEMQKVATLAEKQALMQKRIKEVTDVLAEDKEAYQKLVDEALADNSKVRETVDKLLEVTNNKPTLAEKISAVRNELPDFRTIPTYSLIDALEALQGISTIEKSNSIDEVRNALYDALYALETLETDGQTFGPASINILNFVERASRKLALGGNLSVSEDPLMYMDDDNYNFTAQILFSEWFKPILDIKLSNIIEKQGLLSSFDKADENSKVLIAKEALVNELMNNVTEYSKDTNSLTVHRNLLDIVVSEAIFKLKTYDELEAMLDQTMKDTLNTRISFIRALSKPILQLSGYGSGIKNNTKGFLSSFFMKDIPTTFSKLASVASTNIDKSNKIDLFKANNTLANEKLAGILTPSEVASLRILGVKNLEDFHNLVKRDANGELDFTNLDTALDNASATLTGVVTQALQRVSPFQAQRTTLVMNILNDHVEHLADEINIKLNKPNAVKYVKGESDKAGSIDFTDVPEGDFIAAINAIKDNDETKSLLGILMSAENGSITNFVRRSVEASEEKESDRTPVGTTAKGTRVYFSPVDLSLVTNFGQSMDAKVQGIVQAKLAKMGIFVDLNNFDAFTTSALFIGLVSKLANEAFAELIMDDNANLCKTMLETALENEKKWYKLANPEAKNKLAATIAQTESYLLGLQVAEDLRTINGVQVDNFGGNYRLDMDGNEATAVNIPPTTDPKEYEEALARLYPIDGSNTQKAVEFYTTLVPTLKWLNAYSDLLEAPKKVVHLINELLKKQIELGKRYSNEDIVEKSKIISKAIENFLKDNPNFEKAQEFYKYMSKELSYDTFIALEKLQDTFYTKNPTQTITLAREEFRNNSNLKAIEYGRYFAQKQNSLVTNSMNEVDKKIVAPSLQSNLYVTSLNMIRNDELATKTLDYKDGEYILGGEPLLADTTALLDGEVYSVSTNAYKQLKAEDKNSNVKQILKHLSDNRGMQPNIIAFDTDKYKSDIEAKSRANGAFDEVKLKKALKDDLLSRLESNNLKEILQALAIMNKLRDNPSFFGENYTADVNSVLGELDKEISKEDNKTLLPDSITGKSIVPSTGRENATALLKYLNEQIVPYTIYKDYNKVNEALNSGEETVEFLESLLADIEGSSNDTTEDTTTQDNNTETRGTQSADTTEESIRKDLYKEITLENSFESLVDTFNELSDMSGLDAEHKNMYVGLLNRFFTKTNGDRFFRDGLEIKVYNSTGEASGKFDPKTNKIEIFLGDQRTSIGLSPAEAYMHELIHAVTEYAIQSEEPEAVAIVKNAEAIRSQLMRYYNSNQAKLDLANRLGFTGTDSHKIDSISRIYVDYMNGSISEFITIAMTNKEVQKDLSKLNHKEAKGFIERLVRFFSRLLNALTNTPQEIDLEHNSGSQAVYQLAVRLANNNNQLQSVYKDLKYQSTLQKWLGAADSLTNRTVSQWIKNEATKLEAGNPAKNIYSLAKYLMFAPRNPVIAHKAMKLLVNDFDFSPNGFLATTLSNISTLDDAKRKVNELLAKSANLDKERLMLHTSLQKELKSKFSRDLTPTESKELGKIIQVYDLRAIDNEINRLYPTYFAGKTNSQTRDRIRAEIRETLNDLSQNMSNYLVSGNNNRRASILSYYDEKTQELADYISKGQISSNMLLNAYNIAQCLTLPDVVDNRLKNDNEIISQDKETISALAQKLDKLISLRALVNASDKTLSTFRELYESDLTNAGVVNAFDMHKMSKQGLEDELLTKGVISNEVKGYVRTRTNESVDIIVAPIAEEADLRADGYKLVKNYAKVFNFGGRGLGMYISTTNMQPKFNRGVIRTTSNSSRGMTIQSAVNNMYPLETTAKKQAIVADLISKLKRDNRNQSEEFVPVFDAKGQIVDYRLLLSQKQKEELEIANTDLFDTLPNAITRYMDRVQSEAHNKEILKDLEEYYHKNKGKEEFIYIGPNGIKAHNPKVKKESDLVQLQEIWDLIPGTTKDYIQDNLKGMDNGIYIQASQFASIAGSRDFRLTDTNTFKRIVPLAYFRRVAKMMEYGIIKMGKWVTQKIVLTNPDVIIGNLASNQLVLTTFGLDPVTSMKYYAEGIQYIQAYNYLKEKEVTLKKDVELATDARKKAIAEANLLKIRNKMKSNPIYEFDARGLISDIAEDLPKTEEQQDFIDRAIEKSLNKVGVPQAFREAFDVVMVNEGTTLHSAYASLVKYSDLVARYALYKHMNLTDNLTDQDMFDLLDRAFINYTPAQHPILKYANDIGFARFTKYWLRVQSHISTDLLDKRLGSTMLLHGALKLMGVPISSPLNAIFFRKFMNYDTTFGIPGVTDIDEIYDDLADGLIITNPLVALKKLF